MNKVDYLIKAKTKEYLKECNKYYLLANDVNIDIDRLEKQSNKVDSIYNTLLKLYILKIDEYILKDELTEAKNYINNSVPSYGGLSFNLYIYICHKEEEKLITNK